MTETVLAAVNICADYDLINFIEQFSLNIELFAFKLKKLKEISLFNNESNLEYKIIVDSVIVQFRAMLLENKNSNYTFQAYFNHLNREDITNNINEYLDEGFNVYDQEQKESGVEDYRSVRKAIKFISDKLICHLDKITGTEIGSASYIMTELRNPIGNRNISKILSDILDICKS